MRDRKTSKRWVSGEVMISREINDSTDSLLMSTVLSNTN